MAGKDAARRMLEVYNCVRGGIVTTAGLGCCGARAAEGTQYVIG